MLRVNQHTFYQLASALRPLVKLSESVKLKDFHYELLHANNWLDFLLKNSLIPLVVSRHACTSLRDAIRTVLTPKEGEKSLDPEKELSWHEAKKIFYSVIKNVLTTHT